MKRLLFLLALLLLPAEAWAANKFAVCTTACTWDVANADNVWRTTTGGGTATSVPGASDIAIFDGATCVGGTTCTITVNGTFSIQSINFGACTASTTGCILNFATNNNNITLSVALVATGTGVRELRMGNGTWTLTGASGNIWDATTVTNYTQTPNGSTLAIAGSGGTSGRNFVTGSKTFNAVTFSDAAAIPAALAQTGSPTFASLNITPPFAWLPAASTTTTITAQFSWLGTAFNNVIAIQSPTGVTTTIAAGASGSTCVWCILSKVIFSTNAVNATNSIDAKGNNMNGGSITGPAAGGGGGGGIIGG